jgi:hypothetical protein
LKGITVKTKDAEEAEAQRNFKLANMKKILYVLILATVVISGLLFANSNIKTEPTDNTKLKTISVAEKKAALKKWEATPEGILFREWEASPEGKKVQNAADKISDAIKSDRTLDAVVSAVSLPPGSRLGYGIMVKINGEEYILAFVAENRKRTKENSSSDFELLRQLKVKDKIKIKSRNVSKAPKYAYPIISGEYVEKNNKVIYERSLGSLGC